MSENDRYLKLLISGSRDATPEMLDYARRAVERAYAKEWIIIVGDAEGVDSAVIDHAYHIGAVHIVYGLKKPRHTSLGMGWVSVEGGYLARDRQMARDCDLCLAIWNGVSRGTWYTYNYARKLGKPSWLKNFLNGMLSKN